MLTTRRHPFFTGPLRHRVGDDQRFEVASCTRLGKPLRCRSRQKTVRAKRVNASRATFFAYLRRDAQCASRIDLRSSKNSTQQKID